MHPLSVCNPACVYVIKVNYKRGKEGPQVVAHLNLQYSTYLCLSSFLHWSWHIITFRQWNSLPLVLDRNRDPLEYVQNM